MATRKKEYKALDAAGEELTSNERRVGSRTLSPELASAICRGVRPPQPHSDETVGRKIGLQKCSRRSFGAKKGFSGQVPAAHGAFHGGGPARIRPIAGQKQTRHGGLLIGAPA